MFWLGFAFGIVIMAGLNYWEARRMWRYMQGAGVRVYRSYPTPEEIDEKIGGTD